ncbi:conserved Plasmodium protein, unknown function [Plasmodium chabaudi chabaudi]|uniref:AMMECR1 domain-containing protein n=1 Tax=Plasmodium chabaudi chabaudi TaxID=31271 RepID=A0A1D3LIT2_PLACU|nr:conserved Plasmodium protein, unknown function [Plasmodium chabaudi chabaudi]
MSSSSSICKDDNLSQDKSEAVSKLVENKDIVCSWCFDTLKNKLENKKFNFVPPIIKSLHEKGFKIAFFVKWMKLNNVKDMGSYEYDAYDLKGCIGCLSEIDLLELQYYSLESSLNDTRFSPITLKDLPYLIVTITYIFNFEKCEHVYDWVIGKHGIKINFTINNRRYSSTFLPDVATEHNFDHKTTISHLIRKANYRGVINDDLLKIIQTERYQGVNCSLTYSDYEKVKQG